MPQNGREKSVKNQCILIDTRLEVQKNDVKSPQNIQAAAPVFNGLENWLQGKKGLTYP